jgi:hypothetical protein
MKPLKISVALAWGILLSAAGLNIADLLFPQSISLSPVMATPAEPERQSYCSWHGGVCGCEESQAKCCDGSLSPNWGCDGESEEES